MFRPLLRVLPSLSGNVKLVCDVEVQKSHDDNKSLVTANRFDATVTSASLLPISDNIYKRDIKINLLKSTYDYDLAQFYNNYADVFYKSQFRFQKAEIEPLDRSTTLNERDKAFEYGCSRSSWSYSGKQYEFLAPVYIDNLADLPDEFHITVTADLLGSGTENGSYTITKKIVVKLNDGQFNVTDGKTNILYNNKNLLYNYLYRSLYNINNKIIYIQSQNALVSDGTERKNKSSLNSIFYWGWDVLHGGYIKVEDAVHGDTLLSDQQTMHNFDNILCKGFERNKLVMSQVIPFCFRFDLHSLLSEHELHKLDLAWITVSGKWVKNTDSFTENTNFQTELYDFDINYDKLSAQVQEYDTKNCTVYKTKSGLVPNLLDADFPGLHETNFYKYQFTNRISPDITRWMLAASDEQDPYIINNNQVYSINQSTSFKYRYFPAYNNHDGILGCCDKIIVDKYGNLKQPYDSDNVMVNPTNSVLYNFVFPSDMKCAGNGNTDNIIYNDYYDYFTKGYVQTKYTSCLMNNISDWANIVYPYNSFYKTKYGDSNVIDAISNPNIGINVESFLDGSNKDITLELSQNPYTDISIFDATKANKDIYNKLWKSPINDRIYYNDILYDLTHVYDSISTGSMSEYEDYLAFVRAGLVNTDNDIMEVVRNNNMYKFIDDPSFDNWKETKKITKFGVFIVPVVAVLSQKDMEQIYTCDFVLELLNDDSAQKKDTDTNTLVYSNLGVNTVSSNLFDANLSMKDTLNASVSYNNIYIKDKDNKLGALAESYGSLTDKEAINNFLQVNNNLYINKNEYSYLIDKLNNLDDIPSSVGSNRYMVYDDMIDFIATNKQLVIDKMLDPDIKTDTYSTDISNYINYRVKWVNELQDKPVEEGGNGTNNIIKLNKYDTFSLAQLLIDAGNQNMVGSLIDYINKKISSKYGVINNMEKILKHGSERFIYGTLLNIINKYNKSQRTELSAKAFIDLDPDELTDMFHNTSYIAQGMYALIPVYDTSLISYNKSNILNYYPSGMEDKSRRDTILSYINTETQFFAHKNYSNYRAVVSDSTSGNQSTDLYYEFKPTFDEEKPEKLREVYLDGSNTENMLSFDNSIYYNTIYNKNTFIAMDGINYCLNEMDSLFSSNTGVWSRYIINWAERNGLYKFSDFEREVLFAVYEWMFITPEGSIVNNYYLSRGHRVTESMKINEHETYKYKEHTFSPTLYKNGGPYESDEITFDLMFDPDVSAYGDIISIFYMLAHTVTSTFFSGINDFKTKMLHYVREKSCMYKFAPADYFNNKIVTKKVMVELPVGSNMQGNIIYKDQYKDDTDVIWTDSYNINNILNIDDGTYDTMRENELVKKFFCEFIDTEHVWQYMTTVCQNNRRKYTLKVTNNFNRDIPAMFTSNGETLLDVDKSAWLNTPLSGNIIISLPDPSVIGGYMKVACSGGPFDSLYIQERNFVVSTLPSGTHTMNYKYTPINIYIKNKLVHAIKAVAVSETPDNVIEQLVDTFINNYYATTLYNVIKPSTVQGYFKFNIKININGIKVKEPLEQDILEVPFNNIKLVYYKEFVRVDQHILTDACKLYDKDGNRDYTEQSEFSNDAYTDFYFSRIKSDLEFDTDSINMKDGFGLKYDVILSSERDDEIRKSGNRIIYARSNMSNLTPVYDSVWKQGLEDTDLHTHISLSNIRTCIAYYDNYIIHKNDVTGNNEYLFKEMKNVNIRYNRSTIETSIHLNDIIYKQVLDYCNSEVNPEKRKQLIDVFNDIIIYKTYNTTSFKLFKPGSNSPYNQLGYGDMSLCTVRKNGENYGFYLILACINNTNNTFNDIYGFDKLKRIKRYDSDDSLIIYSKVTPGIDKFDAINSIPLIDYVVDTNQVSAGQDSKINTIRTDRSLVGIQYIASQFHKLVPFTKMTTFDALSSIDTVVKLSKTNLKFRYMPVRLPDSNNATKRNEWSIIYNMNPKYQFGGTNGKYVKSNRGINIIKETLLTRYFGYCRPVLKSVSDMIRSGTFNYIYNIKRKSTNKHLLAEANSNSTGDSVIYKYNTNINKYTPVNIYSDSKPDPALYELPEGETLPVNSLFTYDDVLLQHQLGINYNNISERYIEPEYKHFNASRFCNLIPSIEITSPDTYTYDEVLQLSSDETIFNVFCKYLQEARNRAIRRSHSQSARAEFSPIELLFLYNRYKHGNGCNVKSICIGKDKKTNQKLYRITYIYKLI